MSPLSKIDHMLSLIEDGAWHTLNSLSKRSNIPKQKLQSLCKTLSETKIIELDKTKTKIRITQKWQNMLKNIETEQNCQKTATGSIILPPKRTVNIQGIAVTNLTEKELELSMRINKILEELAIETIG